MSDYDDYENNLFFSSVGDMSKLKELQSLKEENARLKELLKEWVKAYPVVAVTCDLKNFVKIKELLDKTNEVLK